ncbi:MAG: lectin-like protein [Pseudomonadota bacterium]
MKLSFAFAGLLLASATAVQAIPVQWTVASGGNGHWYDVAMTRTLGQDAPTHALNQSFMGMTGYLATITSAGENAFVQALVEGQSAVTNPWISGSDAAQEGTFVYNSGPEAGQLMTYGNWHPGEPNDAGGGEDYVQMYARAGQWYSGNWNDLFNTAYLDGYVVEYSSVATVPVPATLPLLATGLGLLALRRRKAA